MPESNVGELSMNDEVLSKNIRLFNSHGKHVCVCIAVCIFWHKATFPS